MTPDRDLPVVLYARLSKSDDGSHSIRAQITTMRQYAKLYRLRVIEEIIDDGYTAAHLDRPGIERVRALVEAGEVRGVLVAKLDRLVRSVRHLGDLLDYMQSHGVSLASCMEQIDTSTANGLLVVNLLGSVAQWERQQIGERTAASLRQARRDGKHLGNVPFGRRRNEDGRLVPDEAEMRALRKMRRLRRRGMSYGDIAWELERVGMSPRSGGAWRASTIAGLTADCRSKARSVGDL